MTADRVTRRAAMTAFSLSALFLPAALVGCGGPSVPTSFTQLSWDYLPRLKLNVADVEIDASWTPRAGTREVGYLAPMPPVDALRKMAEDRLIAAGTSGRAVFVVTDASIVQSRENYVGNFAVRLDLSTSDGTRSGYAEARVARTRTIQDDSPDAMRAELYDMVKQMMSDMNVEFEYQVRRSLRDYLQTTAPAAPQPGPVDQQDLAPPGGASVAPPDAAPAPGLAPPAPPAAPAPPSVPSAVPFSSPAPTPLVR